MRLPVREYPAIDPPIVSITTVYKGASNEVVESRITELIESRGRRHRGHQDDHLDQPRGAQPRHHRVPPRPRRRRRRRRRARPRRRASCRACRTAPTLPVIAKVDSDARADRLVHAGQRPAEPDGADRLRAALPRRPAVDRRPASLRSSSPASAASRCASGSTAQAHGGARPDGRGRRERDQRAERRAARRAASRATPARADGQDRLAPATPEQFRQHRRARRAAATRSGWAKSPRSRSAPRTTAARCAPTAAPAIGLGIAAPVHRQHAVGRRGRQGGDGAHPHGACRRISRC